MKKIFTLFVALLSVVTISAQAPATMRFAGSAQMAVSGQTIPIASDTVVVKDSYTTIVLPKMVYGQMTIPSLSMGNLTYTMEGNPMMGNAVFTWEKEDTTVTVGEKTANIQNFKAVYTHAENKLTVEASVKYGSMPFAIAYSATCYYVKSYIGKLAVTIDKAYEVDSVTYTVRRYMDGEEEKLDVEVPTFSMTGTTIGDLTSGGYTVKGIAYNTDSLAFFRDYKSDGISMHFKSGSYDKDYEITEEGKIYVTYDDNKNIVIKNIFKPGAMPFSIVTLFDPSAITGINEIACGKDQRGGGQVFNLAGQRVSENAKGIIITNGKKVVR